MLGTINLIYTALFVCKMNYTCKLIFLQESCLGIFEALLIQISELHVQLKANRTSIFPHFL